MTRAPRRVVITGIGLVTPMGVTAGEVCRAWESGLSSPMRSLPELALTPLADQAVAVPPPFDCAQRVGGRRALRCMSEAAVLANAAAREAAAEARLTERFQGEDIGLFAATGLACATTGDFEEVLQASVDDAGQFSCRRFGEQGLHAANPLISFRILANMPPCLLSISEGIKGPNCIFTPWEGQGGAALVEAWRAVRNGEVAAAVTGAADTPAAPSSFVYLRQAHLLAPSEFPASAGAYLVFETAGSAARDGMSVYAAIRDLSLEPGAGVVCDPLSERMGRTFATAPALLMGICAGARRAPLEQAICGVDRQCFRAALEAP